MLSSQNDTVRVSDGTMRVSLSRKESKKLKKALAQHSESAQQGRLFLNEGSVYVHKRPIKDFFRKQPKSGVYLSMDSASAGHSQIMKLQKGFSDFLVEKGVLSQEKADKLLGRANKALISGKGFVSRTASVKIEKSFIAKAGKVLKMGLTIAIPTALGVVAHQNRTELLATLKALPASAKNLEKITANLDQITAHLSTKGLVRGAMSRARKP